MYEGMGIPGFAPGIVFGRVSRALASGIWVL